MPDDHANFQPTFPPGPDRAPSITTMLDRTTPNRLPPLDVDDLARHGRRRQRRSRAVLACAVVALVALSAAVLGAIEPDGRNPGRTATASPPDTVEIWSEPLGSWRQVADPPFSARWDAFGGTLSDGSALVWGGHAPGNDADHLLDGAIYDPASGEWTTIPAAPLPNPAVYYATLTDDRLAVVGTASTPGGAQEGPTLAAVYDVAQGTWHEVPALESLTLERLGDDHAVWDGETLVVLRLAGDTDAPVVYRWRLGDAEWEIGATPPFGTRAFAGLGFDGTQLAVWGGSTTERPPEDSTERDPGALDDGAIYDVGDDSWQELPDSPLSPRIVAAVVWSDGRLLVGGGTDALVDPMRDDNPSSTLPDLAAYDPATESWETLDGLLGGGIGSAAHFNWDVIIPPSSFLVAPPWPTDDDSPRSFLGEAGWESAPKWDLHRLGDDLVATDADALVIDGPGAFAVQVRADANRWHPPTEAPFAVREAPTVVATGDQVLVVGGLSAETGYPTPPPPEDAWVFDLSGD
jgi:hypothetical protein